MGIFGKSASTLPAGAATGLTRFALAMLSRLSAGNLFFSPLSIYELLGLLQVGASGATARELEDVLATELPRDAIGASLATMLAELATTRDATLARASRLWAASDLPLEPSFQAATQGWVGTGVERMDFSRPQRARAAINAWIAERTLGKIPELLGREAITADMALVLTSAVYFLGSWRTPFTAALTRQDAFALGTGERVQVRTMTLNGHLAALEVPDAHVAELPYGDSGRLAFVLLVPREKNGLANLEQQLTAVRLEELLGALKSRDVMLSMPSFGLRSRLDLSPALRALGLRSLFSHAELARLTSSQQVFLSSAIHEAVVQVDERGTEAAAATAMAMRSGRRPVERTPLVIRADQPFLFLIRDTFTGAVLFLGRVTDPRSR